MTLLYEPTTGRFAHVVKFDRASYKTTLRSVNTGDVFDVPFEQLSSEWEFADGADYRNFAVLQTHPRRAHDCEECPVCGGGVGWVRAVLARSEPREVRDCPACSKRIPVHMTLSEIAFNARFAIT